MKLTIPAAVALAAVTLAAPMEAEGADFFDTGAAPRFVEINAHVLTGTVSVMQNYASTFPMLTDIHVSPGWTWGAGGTVTLGIRNWLGVSTELNFMGGHYAVSAAMPGAGQVPMSAIYLRNRLYSFNVPVYVAIRFNVSDNVRWTVQGGFYYNIGVAGKQRQSVYTSYINELGQLINIHQRSTVDYYNCRDAFINSAYRSDWGVHIGMGLDLGRHVTVGFRTHLGLKNAANVTEAGLERPSVHNVTATGLIGWRF